MKKDKWEKILRPLACFPAFVCAWSYFSNAVGNIIHSKI